MSFRIICYIVLFLATISGTAWTEQATSDGPTLQRSYSGTDGSLEIGGPFVGAEFHRSRPAPSRISFYQPVANSIDISRDYWTRDSSLVLQFMIRRGDRVDTLGSRSFNYTWSPTSADFTETLNGVSASISYRFCGTIPAMLFSLAFDQISSDTFSQGELIVELQTTLRTCHTYAWRHPETFLTSTNNNHVRLDYSFVDTDTAAVFLRSNSSQPVTWETILGAPGTGTGPNQVQLLRATIRLETIDTMDEVVTFVLGSAQSDSVDEYLALPFEAFVVDAERFSENTTAYVTGTPGVFTPDTTLTHTQRWSRAVRTSTRHAFGNSTAQMPCPAQYNFFFTHDVLVNGLGVVYSDINRVRTDLLQIKQFTEPGTTLAHARYWKDSTWVTEYCAADSWNHLWFILLTASYLRHSGDEETVRSLLPVAEASAAAVMTQRGEDGLMHGSRPDWWDIGNVPGPKAYLTILTARAMEEYAATLVRLDLNRDEAQKAAAVARELRENLLKLWDDDAGYLLNINNGELDPHYYSGSLTAVWFNLLDDKHADTLLAAAERELLDPNLGIRNAVPMDFHLLEEQYNFVGSEQGGPGVYANGGIWPQGTAWYILALLERNRGDDALAALKGYLTVDGVADSPNGQPSFYEYRKCLPSSTEYGEVDKPTFLWMGGWFEYCLYHLAGCREDPWHVYTVPNLPSEWENTEYSMYVDGRLIDIYVTGKGPALRQITADGLPVYSAIINGDHESWHFERGVPEMPYLAKVNALVQDVQWSKDDSTLTVDFITNEHSIVDVVIVSPGAPVAVHINDEPASSQTVDEGEWKRVTISSQSDTATSRLVCRF